MQLSGVRLVFASFLLAGVGVAGHGVPGDLVAVISPNTLLKPLLNSTPSGQKVERRESVLRGLLEVRQSSCPVGWSGCSSGGCCPIGGQCCANDKCCDTGNHCCQGGGCCELGDNCVEVVSTGERGCCPIGHTCVGNGGSPCVTPSYLPCPNDNFCCPPGDTCFRDSVGDRQCGSPGSTPRPSSRPLTTFTSSSTRSLTSVGPGTVTGLVPSVYATPTPLPGTQTVIIHSGDTRILWIGTSWLLATSSCNATEESKKTTVGGHSFTFTVASAKSVYLALSARNVEYDITINGRTTTYTETTALHDCKLSWSSGIITTSTTLISVAVRGPATTTTSTGPSNWSFEFHNFLVTMSDEVAASNSVFGNPSGANPTDPPRATSTATGPRSHPAFYTCLVAVLVVLFAFF